MNVNCGNGITKYIEIELTITEVQIKSPTTKRRILRRQRRRRRPVVVRTVPPARARTADPRQAKPVAVRTTCKFRFPRMQRNNCSRDKFRHHLF